MGQRGDAVAGDRQVTEPGRVVLVTGGSRGIGLGVARAFVALGDRVAVTYRSKPPEDADLVAIKADVTSVEEVDAAFGAVEERWGPVEVLVANAGITKDGLLLRMGEADFADVVDTNLTGAYRCAKRAAGPMVRARSGRMIFVSSVAGLAGSAGQVNYAASKAGLVGMARSIGRELASRNITANVVAPGPVATDMTDALPEARRAELAATVPLGRFATVDEVAAAVTFLASAGAASITGAVLPVDGGLGMGH
jgi:3-oxoacyl-[acyl-carrier protein] reductase